jgi:hypothetical protein
MLDNEKPIGFSLMGLKPLASIPERKSRTQKDYGAQARAVSYYLY